MVARLFNSLTWAAVLLLLSLQFQLVNNESPLNAGLRLLPFELAFLAVGPISGRLADQFGHRLFTLSGIIFSSAALLLFSTVDASTSYSMVRLYLILLGVGTGLFLAPNAKSIMSVVPDSQHGVGSALIVLFLNIGFAVSLNLVVLVMSLTAPYAVITRVILAVNPMALAPSDTLLFLASLKNAYLALAIINALAIPPLLLRNKVNK